MTPSLTLDATYNTDFSQVEADEERVNLTRFPLFFPEKRDFFLENAGIFEFGDISNYLYRMSPSRYSRSFTMFHSRRIGLESGKEVPIAGGSRLSGKVGNFDVGYLNMLAEKIDDIPQTQFNVARIKGNILQKSNFGAILIDRNSNGEGKAAPVLRSVLSFPKGSSFSAYFSSDAFASKVSTCDGPPFKKK